MFLGLASWTAVRAAGEAPTGEGRVLDLVHPPAVSSWPPETARRDLLRRLAGSDKLTVLLIPEPGATAESYAGLIRSRPGRRPAPTIRFVTPDQGRSMDLSGPLLVVGPAGAAIASYLATTPYPASESLTPGETLRVTSMNPWDPSSSMMMLTGGDGASVRAALPSIGVFRSYDYELLRDGTRIRYGRFVAESGQRWRIDPSTDVDMRTRLRQAEHGSVRVVYLEGELNGLEAGLVAAGIHETMIRFVRRLGGGGSIPPVEVHLYQDLEIKGVRTTDPRPSHLMPAEPGRPLRAHMIFPAGSTLEAAGPDARLALARAAIRIVFGDLKPAALADGGALVLAGGLLGRDLDWWERRLAVSGMAPTPGDLLEESAYSEHSYLLAMPASAILVRRLAGRDAEGDLGRVLRNPDLMRTMRREPAAVSGAPVRAPATVLAPAPPGFQKGMGLAHEGYAVVDGYGSRSAFEQMRRLKALGAGWVALSPYAFMSDPDAESISFQRSEEQGAGSENDHALLATMAAAHRLGLKVMIKPQIWLRGEHWSGEVAMRTEESWKLFFARYREFLAHYALLAAAGDADLLVTGVEMQGTTGREAVWREMISMSRALFDGPLTYAANWGREFETLGFWDALDFVGLDCYYPLSEEPNPGDEELLEGARRVAGRAEQVFRKTGRPVLLTEVGFPAIAGAWMAPHDEDTGRAFDPGAQARAYRAILTAFWDRPWLAGIYWWKWPTSPPGSRPEPPFSPRGRPAEEVLAEWYGRSHTPKPDWPTGSP